ncbi:PIG-L deacetylase family protein [Paenibacillus rigui]|uniref:GlcNAc-PI de-N-acetylase n=1 Tax=Paenibacillus rigui TaxID=554312 RepID=A0A229UYH1_9BACL|nr:PIG-L family deacetylase [Paenibacillus rigui]OXM87999.1 GlcNAc-PI de-N-acetylase [Paenibacillus rigui]
MNQTAAFIYAHPDDETFLSGCLIRQLADRGAKPILLLATKGDAGKKNGSLQQATNEELAAVRVKEMDKAAHILGLSLVEHLGYPDGKLNTVPTEAAVEAILAFINTHQPENVFTFGEDGGNGHPDHIAISKLTTSAATSGRCPSVRRLFYVASETLLTQGLSPAISVDTEPNWAVKAAALRAHDSQMLAIERYFGSLASFPEHRRYESFVLAWEQGIWFPPVTGEASKSVPK